MLTNNHLCKVIGLEVREVENLIPLQFLQKACENDINYSNGFNSVSNVVSRAGSHFLPFLDIKDGLTKRKYHTTRDENYRRFINNALVQSGLYTGPYLIEILESEVETLDGTPLINGLGSTIMERCLEKISEFNNVKALKSLLLDEQLTEWTRIGEIFTNWTCSSQRML